MEGMETIKDECAWIDAVLAALLVAAAVSYLALSIEEFRESAGSAWKAWACASMQAVMSVVFLMSCRSWRRLALFQEAIIRKMTNIMRGAK